jgi:hypothetical protein
MNNITSIVNNNKILVLLIIIFIHFIIIKTNIGNNVHFKAIVSIYGSMGLFLTIYNMYISSKNTYANTVSGQLSYLNQLFQNISQTISSFFTANKNMKYFFDEIFNDKINTDESIRDTNLEQIFTNNILTNVDSLINYIDSFKLVNGTNFQLKIMEEKLEKLLNQLMKSKIFVENWNKFKTTLALKWTKNYIDLYYNK